MRGRRAFLVGTVAAITIAVASTVLAIPRAAVAAGKDATRVTTGPQPTSGSQPNLSGTWKLDPSRSDDPQKTMPGRGGPGSRGDRSGGGDHGKREMRRNGTHEGAGGPGGPPPGVGPQDQGGRPMRRGPMRMPADFALVQLPGGIELRDSLGVVFQRVITTGDGDVARTDASGVAQLRGKWMDQGLTAESQGPRGGTMHETYQLSDGGKTLQIKTQLQPPGDRPPIEFTRTYVRVGG